MKKIFLKIKNPGIMFQLGNKKFRSPAEIDVTHLKVDNIISQMRIYGVTDFEITTNEQSSVVKEKQKTNVIIIETKHDEIEKINLKIDEIEKVLKDLVNQNKREQNNTESKKIKETDVEIKSDIKLQEQPKLKVQTSSKNILIEELEDLEETEKIKDLDEPEKVFKSKDFKLGTVDPFITLPDIENLKSLKKL
jgi:hypothetical protein